jgi:hypothetical protein
VTTASGQYDPRHHADQVALWIEVDLLDRQYADADTIPVRKEWLAALVDDRKHMTELLEHAATALRDSAKAALTVKPTLTQPYRDAPDWTPWTRFVEAPTRAAHNLAVSIRRHLHGIGVEASGDD